MGISNSIPYGDDVMPSPFPGMNPYLEQSSVWHDFHESFMPLAREVLSSQVLPRYIVKIDEHLYIHETTEATRRLIVRADLHVAGLAPSEGRASAAAQVLEAPAEVTAVPMVDFERHPYLEIRDRETRTVITVVEFLSPSNKYAGPDRDQYVAQRWELLYSSVNLVEIDLLRGGPRMPWQDMPECDYCVIVSRPEQWPRAGVWPIRLRERLPEIPVPLRPGEADARLDLQQILHRIYDAAGYGYYIYTGQPEPALSAEDAAWASQILAASASGT
jgi:hypothetical protein